MDPAAAEARFWTRVDELGAWAAPGARYVNSRTPVDLICAQGHACNPSPTGVIGGQGVCSECQRSFDRVYLIAHSDAAAIKIGVASSQRRVSDHYGRGYRVCLELQGLAHQAAARLERSTIRWWREEGWSLVWAAPVDGRTETTSLDHLEATIQFVEWQLSQLTARDKRPGGVRLIRYPRVEGILRAAAASTSPAAVGGGADPFNIELGESRPPVPPVVLYGREADGSWAAHLHSRPAWWTDEV